MSEAIVERLNRILPRVTSPDFLRSEGIGNEIACYIFDYAPADEIAVRDHIAWMLQRLPSHHGNLRVLHLNLLDVVVAYLKERKLFDKTLEMQQTKGDDFVLKALKGPLAAEKLRDAIAAQHALSSYDLIFVSGVGSVWPMMRVHGLLNCLHTVIGRTPLVMFYPGTFDGTSLKLFGRIAADAAGPHAKNYYRAFSLIPRS